MEVSGLPNAVGIKLQVNVSVLYNCWTEQTKDGILNANEGPGASSLLAFADSLNHWPSLNRRSSTTMAVAISWRLRCRQIHRWFNTMIAALAG